jgi:beta-glucanase (GH16 family)
MLSGMALVSSEPTPRDAYVDEGYELVWAEEFDEPGRPNPDNWGYEHGFSRNREAQWYQPQNAEVRDGLLVIEARRERVANTDFDPDATDWRRAREYAEYTSASLRTKDQHAWTYGRFEMRGRIDIREGLWPAWWTVGFARPWPGGGEIDMMEYYDGVVLANACWKSPGGRWDAEWDAVRTPVAELAGDMTPEQWADEFHVWRMDWTEDRIELFLDGRLLNTIDLSETVNPDGSNPFDEPHYMIVNLAIGGQHGGDPDRTEFPARFEVDFIRVYQKPGR